MLVAAPAAAVAAASNASGRLGRLVAKSSSNQLVLLVERRRGCASKAAKEAPRVAVVGTGLVGLTAADSLRQRGFRVTLIDRQPTVAGECSFANAALLMRSYSRPKTATMLQLIKWSTSFDQPVHVSWRAFIDPYMALFGMRFFLSGPQTEKAIQATTQITDKLARLSIEHIEDIIKKKKLDVSLLKEGVLMYCRDPAKLNALVEETKSSFPPEQHADRFRVVSAEECLKLEPLLENQKAEIVGGLFWFPDQTICSLTFCRQLASKLAEEGVEFIHGEEVTSTFASGSNPRAAVLQMASGKKVEAEAIVLAAGVGTGRLLSKLSPTGAPPVPLYGMRGHSCTVDVTHMVQQQQQQQQQGGSSSTGSSNHVIQRSLCDADSMVFFSPLQDESDKKKQLMRIAAFGDFDGWGYGPEGVRSWRMEQMLSVAEKNFGSSLLPGGGSKAISKRPLVAKSSLGDKLCPSDDDATRWTGLRPMSPDGLPLVGQVGSVGPAPVFVNTGHGALGWTLSGGTAEVLGELVCKTMKGPETMSDSGVQKKLLELADHLEPSRFRWPEVFRRCVNMYIRGVSN